MTSCIHKTQKWTIPIRHIKDHNSGKNQPTVRWIHIGMSYCSFHVDILKIHHFVCVFLNVQPNHSVLQGCDFWQCGQKTIVYADILYFVEHVFSWNVAGLWKRKTSWTAEGAIASFYSTCYIKIWIPSVD